MKKNLKKRNLTALLFVLCLCTLQACRKDVLVSDSNGIHNRLSIEEAKNYFNEHIKSTVVPKKLMSTSGTGNPTNEQLLDNMLAARQPIWESAYQQLMSSGASSVKIPLDLGPVFMITDEGKKEMIPFGALNYLFMYKDSLQHIHSQWITLLPDRDWLYGNRGQYTGDIQVKTWEGTLLRQFHYDRHGATTSSHASATRKISAVKKISNDLPEPEIPMLQTVCISFGNRSKCTCINKNACDMCWQCTSNVCRTFPAGAVIPEDNDPGFWGTGATGGGGSPGGVGGGGYAYYPPDYVPPGCISDPSYNIPSYPAPSGYEWAAPCGGPGGGIPTPIGPNENALKLGYIINSMGITDPVEQNFLLNNQHLYDTLQTFLTDNVNTTEHLDYVKWAVSYLLANQNVSIDELDYDNLSLPSLTEISTYENLTIDLSETKLPIDPRLITKYPKLMNVIKGLHAKVSSTPKIMTALKKYTGLSETAILTQLKVNKVGPTLVVRPNEQMKAIRAGKVVYSYGMFKPNEANKLFIYLNEDYVDFLENSTSANYDKLELFISTIVLHEYVHWAGYNFNLFPSLGNVEYGELFEKDAFGGIIYYNSKNGKVFYNKN